MENRMPNQILTIVLKTSIQRGSKIERERNPNLMPEMVEEHKMVPKYPIVMTIQGNVLHKHFQHLPPMRDDLQ